MAGRGLTVMYDTARCSSFAIPLSMVKASSCPRERTAHKRTSTQHTSARAHSARAHKHTARSTQHTARKHTAHEHITYSTRRTSTQHMAAHQTSTQRTSAWRMSTQAHCTRSTFATNCTKRARASVGITGTCTHEGTCRRGAHTAHTHAMPAPRPRTPRTTLSNVRLPSRRSTSMTVTTAGSCWTVTALAVFIALDLYIDCSAEQMPPEWWAGGRKAHS